jgi:hypothetical protein
VVSILLAILAVITLEFLLVLCAKILLTFILVEEDIGIGV